MFGYRSISKSFIYYWLLRYKPRFLGWASCPMLLYIITIRLKCPQNLTRLPRCLHWYMECNSHVMTTSSNGNIFRITGPLCGNSPVNSPHKGQWRGALIFSLICAWTKGWVNNLDAGDLRRHLAHYNVTVMLHLYTCLGCKAYPK